MNDLENKIKVLFNLFKSKEFDLMVPKCKKLLREFPEYVILYNILGSTYQSLSEFNLAKDIFIKGLRMDPTNVAIMNNLANVHKSLDEIKLSENLFNKIIKNKPDYLNAYINLGNLQRDNNNFEKAIDLYNEALKINNQNSVTLYSLALAHQGLGNFALAIEFAEKTVSIDPKFTQADMLISQCTKYKLENEHYKKMNLKNKELELNDTQKVNLLFAIAKANEDLNNIEKSFEYLNKANKINRKLLDFDINSETIFFNKIKEIFNQINLNKISNENVLQKKIIFILGMPRSGTSLVEQVITSHSKVFGAGELPQLSKIIKDKFMSENSLSTSKINRLIEDKSFLNSSRNTYYDYLARFNAKENIITDKAPLNFRWIGLIKILFPNSKIIHCSRDPKDNCLSLYKNYFEGGLNFSYNQKELVSYFGLYSDLMNFWNKKFSSSIFEAKYEKIIEQPEKEIKKIINFCDLDWEDNCLKFYNNKTPIKTMSTAQARRPIYNSSVNSYAKFASFLEEINKII